jgi:hypothetical protein
LPVAAVTQQERRARIIHPMVLAAGREDCLRPRGKTSSGGRNDSQNARQEFAAEKVYPFPVVVTESHAFATIALDFHR